MAALDPLPANHAAPPTTVNPNRLGGWRRAVLWPLGLLLRAWGASLRFEVSEQALKNFRHDSGAAAFVLWHNRLFLTAEIFRRYRRGRPVYGLVSSSRDGAWLDAFFGLAGMRTVRGSSSRGGREAARALVQVLQAGHDVGITPDGPRGPAYDFKAGALVVARRAQASVLLVGAEFQSAWRLPSWDGFYLPRPFSRVRVQCDYVAAAELDRPAAAEKIALRLREINPDRR